MSVSLRCMLASSGSAALERFSTVLGDEDQLTLPNKTEKPELPSKLEPTVDLPNELLLLVFAKTDTSVLLTMRYSSTRMKRLVEVVLASRLESTTTELSVRRTLSAKRFFEAEKVKRPHLRHYRQFLRNISTNEITEATWYTTPPPELQTVCECLCILKGTNSFSVGMGNNGTATTTSTSSPGRSRTPSFEEDSNNSANISISDGALDSEPRMTWPTIKKLMTRYDFKTWLTNLRMGVDHIPYAAAKRVERIIMLDPSITYERLRDVSMAGHKLLIIVAACLQYCTISEDLRIKSRELSTIDRSLDRAALLLECVRDPAKALEVKEQMERTTERTLVGVRPPLVFTENIPANGAGTTSGSETPVAPTTITSPATPVPSDTQAVLQRSGTSSSQGSGSSSSSTHAATQTSLPSSASRSLDRNSNSRNRRSMRSSTSSI